MRVRNSSEIFLLLLNIHPTKFIVTTKVLIQPTCKPNNSTNSALCYGWHIYSNVGYWILHSGNVSRSNGRRRASLIFMSRAGRIDRQTNRWTDTGRFIWPFTHSLSNNNTIQIMYLASHKLKCWQGTGKVLTGCVYNALQSNGHESGLFGWELVSSSNSLKYKMYNKEWWFPTLFKGFYLGN